MLPAPQGMERPIPAAVQMDQELIMAENETKPLHQVQNPGYKFMPQLCWRVAAGEREKHYGDQAELIREAFEYFQFIDASPIFKPHMLRTGKATFIPKMRPYSKSQLFTYLGIKKRSWLELQKSFPDACEWIEQTIDDQLLHGGLSENMNAMLVARMLGLSEKTEAKVDQSNVDNTPKIDEDLIACLVHPDDPDPTGMDTGIFPRPLYSQQQLDAGVPFHAPQPKEPEE